jgi:hypothetical protein
VATPETDGLTDEERQARLLDPEWLAYWDEASKTLMPDKTVTRLTERAKYLVTTVSVVGTLLTGLGILTVTITDNDTLMVLAFIVLVLASSAVCVALVTLLARMKWVRPGNLLDVEKFYLDEIHRKRPVLFASALLVAAAGLAAVTGLVAAGQVVFGSPDLTNRATLAANTGEDGTIDIAVGGSITGMDDDQVLAIRIATGTGDDLQLSALALAYPDKDGTVKLDQSVSKLDVDTLDTTATLDIYDRADIAEDGTLTAHACPVETYILTTRGQPEAIGSQ